MENLGINLVKREKQIIYLGYQKRVLTIQDVYRYYKDKVRALETIRRLVEFDFFKLGKLPLTYVYVDDERNQRLIGKVRGDLDPEYNKRFEEAIRQSKLV